MLRPEKSCKRIGEDYNASPRIKSPAQPKEAVMKNALRLLILVTLVSVLSIAVCAQNREKFVISAHAGGVNAVTGRAAVHAPGNTDWQQLTSQDDLDRGDVVRTGLDGRVEMLLNPGSYLRVGENSEFELTDNSLENLEVRLVRGTAIVEVTGADDTELLINITTPHARMAIVRRGLYRVNVVPGDLTELIVRKGRVMLDGNHTKIKGGNKVVFSDNSFSVAKLGKGDPDLLDSWSKTRAQTLARANSRITARQVNSLVASYGDSWWFLSAFSRRGLWLYDAAGGCFTFFPFSYGWNSPYGISYQSGLYGNQRPGFGTGFGWPGSGGVGSGGSVGSGAGSGSGLGSGSGSSLPSDPRSNSIGDGPSRGREVSPNVHRPRNP